MSQKPDGGPAFPQIESDLSHDRDNGEPYTHTYSYGGMSLRDYFAGQMLVGVFSSGSHERVAKQVRQAHDAFCMTSSEVGSVSEKAIAGMCYAMADAMISEREK